MNTETKDDHGLSQAKAQAESIIAMVAAAECDYDRLEELREQETAHLEAKARVEECEAAYQYHDSDDTKSTPEWADLVDAREELEANPWDDSDAEELRELLEAAGDCEDTEDAEQRILDDALSVEVRSDWRSVGDEDDGPAEFRILLCTGGPAVQIRGTLNRFNEPDRAWLEYQDWGTPWTRYFNIESDTLLAYASRFYFGE